MTLEELRAILVPFALGVKGEFDGPTQRAYLRFLKDVPVPLLQAARDAAEADLSITFMPAAPEWRARCEVERLRLAALHPYEACTACNGVGTVRTSPVGSLRPTYGPCACRRAHLAKLERLGIPSTPFAQLPAARVEPESAPVLEIEDAPPAVSDRVRALAERAKWV